MLRRMLHLLILLHTTCAAIFCRRSIVLDRFTSRCHLNRPHLPYLFRSEVASPTRARKPGPPTPPPTAMSSRSNSTSSVTAPVLRRKPPKELFFPSATTVLQPHNTLTYHLITEHLALLALIPTA